MRHKLRLFLSVLLLSSLDAIGVAQQDQVQPMERHRCLEPNVVTRTTKAAEYRKQGGSTKVDLHGTELMPQAAGEAKVESKTGRLQINAKLSGMEPANKFGLEYLNYVLWAITPEGRANNLREVVLDNGTSDMQATTDLQASGLIVTAEPYFAVTQPSDLVVAENIVRRETKGREGAINVKYELLPKGLYVAQVEPLRDVVYGIDCKASLDLFEARNAIRIARAAKADQYASSSFAKTETDLKQAQNYYRRKQGRTPIGTVAREAIQTAEEARVMSLKRQEEDRVEREKQAAAAREAQAKSDAEAQTERSVQAETERASAGPAKAEAERAKQESDLAAQKAAQERQEAQAAQAATLAQQHALQAENEKVRSQAEEAGRGRHKAESEKAEMRARLLQQLNAVLVTRDTAQGLIATMPDVLFETNQYVLRPAARESLAKVAGIVLAYSDLRLEVGEHTDSVGGDAYNQQLSEKRAASVRYYLAQQGIPLAFVTVRDSARLNPSPRMPQPRVVNRIAELSWSYRER